MVRRHPEQNLRVRRHRHSCPLSIPPRYWHAVSLLPRPLSTMDRTTLQHTDSPLKSGNTGRERLLHCAQLGLTKR